jgi:glycosyltransferase domain-containing protein
MMQSSGQAAEQTVTLIIPTVYRRAKLFHRTLRYLASSGFLCPIVVSDHSPPGHLGTIADIARQHANLNINLLQHPPELHFLDRLVLCAEAANTPYVHLHADDDFLIRASLEPLIKAMAGRPDCAAAMGSNISLHFISREVAMSPKVAIEKADPFTRLIAQLENYSSVLYALRRRDEFIASIRFAVTRCPDVQFWQFLESCLAALTGAVAVIEQLHYVREVHPNKWSTTLFRERSPDHFPYLILSPELGGRIAAFRSALIEACEVRSIVCDRAALDRGLIHLLHRSFGAMGLPESQVAQNDQTQEIGSRLWSRLRDANDPARHDLDRIIAMAHS